MTKVDEVYESIQGALSEEEQSELAERIKERLAGPSDFSADEWAAIARAREQKARGEGMPASEFFAALRKKHGFPPRSNG